MSLGDRIVIMDLGGVAQVGTRHYIYFSPLEEFVANFIGIMNRIDGIISDEMFTGLGGQIAVSSARTGPVCALFRPENTSIVGDPIGLSIDPGSLLVV